ncbi:NAD(P)H-binding protein [Rhabdochromatium marinum]|uniref:NAD(P)H-binding protein n=1 Tax=Rhabdochromatium marinum TaxID=48729 RepID=UPI00190497F4|nr:NAD(P)H-binding protein [Rhabdochromatium marinum]MBK1649979.1 nucleoside-diphosphate sugar epimerase [Rhabdochromatium marinum]
MTATATTSRAHVPRIAVAGASGFIGTALCPHLAEQYQVRALTRSPTRAARPSAQPGLEWEYCDLFSVEAIRHGLRACDFAIYLVHSQAPSSRLTQAQPRDMDLILADNFALAAAAHGLRQILFVSGLPPRGFEFAPLLWNRREVEMVLAARGTPVTALRTSLVVGPGGSGPALLVDLVRRLPVFLLPPGADSLTRPIALTDLIRALLHCLGHPETYTGAFDIGGADCLSYAEMLRLTAAALGRKRVFMSVPVLPPSLAALSAQLVSGAALELVGAIVESLPQDTQMRDNPVQRAIAAQALGFRAMLAALLKPSALPPRARASWQPADQAQLRAQSRVRSIQRILTPPGLDAAWVAGNYFRWLGRCCFGLVKTQVDAAGHWTVNPRWLPITLLRLEYQPTHSDSHRRVYHISGGWLARTPEPEPKPRSELEAMPASEPRPAVARFEFQTLLDGRYTMAAIHDYAPALPWWLYRFTQAPLHLWVMRRYQERLARLLSAR